MNPIANVKKKSAQKDMQIDIIYLLEIQIQALTEELAIEKDPVLRRTITTDLKTLIEVEEKYRKLDPEGKLSPDAVLGAIANLMDIILILNFEKVGIITSKALGFVMKARLK